MPMSKSIADLRALSDEDLIHEHDETARSTVVGTNYYLDELARRESKRSADAVLQNTITVRNLTWAIGVLTALTVVLVAVTVLRG